MGLVQIYWLIQFFTTVFFVPVLRESRFLSRVEGRKSSVEGQMSRVESKKSRVESKKSRVESKKSRVEGKKSSYYLIHYCNNTSSKKSYAAVLSGHSSSSDVELIREKSQSGMFM